MSIKNTINLIFLYAARSLQGCFMSRNTLLNKEMVGETLKRGRERIFSQVETLMQLQTSIVKQLALHSTVGQKERSLVWKWEEFVVKI